MSYYVCKSCGYGAKIGGPTVSGRLCPCGGRFRVSRKREYLRLKYGLDQPNGGQLTLPTADVVEKPSS